MSFLDQIKNEIIKAVNSSLGSDYVSSDDLICPPNPEMGDLSLACFTIAKKQGKNPTNVAKELSQKIKIDKITEIKATGPYLNFKISLIDLAQNVISEIKKENYGASQNFVGKKIVIEYANQNTHKEVHIGHLRNFIYGESVKNILSANGYEITPISYINDFGINVAKVIWHIMKFGQTDLDASQGEQLAQAYILAVKQLEDNDEYKQEVEEVKKNIEKQIEPEYKLWQETRQWSIDYFAQIYKELKISPTKTYYESELIDKGKVIVDDLIKKGICKESEGAIVADLENFNLGMLVVIRSDGTALYPVADLPLAIAKFEEFNPDKSIYIVDIRQNLYFKQLFKILELLGYKKEMVHLGYDFVKLPDGMMSSRTGNIISYAELKEKINNKVIDETKTRHPDWSQDKIEQVARIITIGAIKFEMIKVSASSIITFDINQALRFDRFTAAYLQYTCARVNSIIRKSEIDINNTEIDYQALSDIKEHELVMMLAKLGDIVIKAGENYDPSCIAKYLFELAQLFNDYYHQAPILQSEENIKIARLSLIKAVRQVIVNGLELLGIEIIEEM